MVLGVVGGVEVVREVAADILVDIGGIDLRDERVGVRSEGLDSVAVVI